MVVPVAVAGMVEAAHIPTAPETMIKEAAVVPAMYIHLRLLAIIHPDAC